MPYLFQRKQFGQHIGDFQAMQHQYAQAAVDIECVRLLTYNAARRKMAGLPFVKEAAMAKLKASQVAESVSSQCIEWMGGVGLTKDMPQVRSWEGRERAVAGFTSLVAGVGRPRWGAATMPHFSRPPSTTPPLAGEVLPRLQGCVEVGGGARVCEAMGARAHRSRGGSSLAPIPSTPLPHPPPSRSGRRLRGHFQRAAQHHRQAHRGGVQVKEGEVEECNGARALPLKDVAQERRWAHRRTLRRCALRLLAVFCCWMYISEHT